MQETKIATYLFFVLLGIAFFLTFKIFEPYLYSIILAVVFSVVFYPLYGRILAHMPKAPGLASFITVAIVFTLVLLPLVLFGIQISDEIKHIYDYTFGARDGSGFLQDITEKANDLVAYFNGTRSGAPFFDIADTENYALNILTWLREHFSDIFSGLAKFFVNLFIFSISFFYFLKDGNRFTKDVILASPFKDDRDEAILQKLKTAILSVVKGSIFVAIIQGVVSGIGFFIFGLPSATLWGGVTAVAALVPGFGTSLVVGPAILYLLFTGKTVGAIGLLVWGVIAVGLIDNILGPKFIEKGMNIHPLIILLSALGGLSFFGPIGFLLGPITISFLFSLFDIYKNIIVRENKDIVS